MELELLWSLQEKRGTLFCLADESHRNNIGMACVIKYL